jgi:hypothetical protein
MFAVVCPYPKNIKLLIIIMRFIIMYYVLYDYHKKFENLLKFIEIFINM